MLANDAGFPTGTGYSVSLLDSSGNTLFSYPELWQFFGPGSTYNLSQGIPYYHGQVTYPIPILTIPYNHNPQSISGPISLSNYNLYNVAALGIGTANPAWGIDVEGSDLLGLINAKGGYLVNGTVGSAGTCLGSDGTAYDMPVACNTSFYQTIQFNGVAVPQESILNFLSPLTVADGSSKTNIGVNTTGTEAKLVTAAGSSPAGYYAVWDPSGGLTGVASVVTRTCNANGCYVRYSDGTLEQWGHTSTVSSGTAGTVTATFPTSFSTTANLEVVVSETGEPAGDGNPHPADCHISSGPSTTGFSAVAGITVQPGGSGYDHFTGQYCSWHAFGY